MEAPLHSMMIPFNPMDRSPCWWPWRSYQRLGTWRVRSTKPIGVTASITKAGAFPHPTRPSPASGAVMRTTCTTWRRDFWESWVIFLQSILCWWLYNYFFFLMGSRLLARFEADRVPTKSTNPKDYFTFWTWSQNVGTVGILVIPFGWGWITANVCPENLVMGLSQSGWSRWYTMVKNGRQIGGFTLWDEPI